MKHPKNLPVTQSTLSAQHLGEFLDRNYKFDSKVNCKLFRTGINHLYMVGVGKDKFVLRVYTLNWRTKLEIEEELRLLNHLHENKVSVSYPIPDRNGTQILEVEAPEGRRYCVLFSFAEGNKIPQFNEEVSFDIGMTMGKMHKVAENFKLDRITYSPDVLLVNSTKAIRSFFGDNNEEVTFLENTAQQLLQEYDKVQLDDIRKGVIHLDIWFDNVHVGKHDNITLFDFDFCGNGWLCYDIAYFLLQLFNTQQDEKLYERKAASFLKGYETVVSISEEEMRIIPLLGVSIWIFYMSVQCDRFDNWSNIFLTKDYLKRYVRMIKKWMECKDILLLN
jgi:Ser/Thr protein kinase RdoA (MazF antagonist)